MALINTAEAHEVYVLTPVEVVTAKQTPREPFLPIISSHLNQFIGWGVLVLGLLVASWFIARTKWSLKRLTARFDKLKRFAPRVTEITVGLALLASAYYDDAFGPELSFMVYGSNFAWFIRGLLVIAAISLLFKLKPKVGAVLGLIVYALCGVKFGWYILSYGVYAGDLAFVLIPKAWERYRFLVLRALFGGSLIFASVYAKLLYNHLAIDTITKYQLTNFFPFDPSFLLIGAFFVELLIGLLYISGIQVRLTSVVFGAFLISSVLFFKESVWPHVVLFGTALAMFCYGEERLKIH